MEGELMRWIKLRGYKIPARKQNNFNFISQ